MINQSDVNPAALASQASVQDYLAIARFDHMTKHVFIVPGIVLAYALHQGFAQLSVERLLLGFASAILIASANYVINEWLDRSSDAYHPVKSQRTAVHRSLSPILVYSEYLALLLFGLLLGYQLGILFFTASVAFGISGITYNIEPIRTKDKAYLDVISESVNNPIRLILGWAMVDPHTLPPASLFIAYWAGGAFLMGAKRLSEYRDVVAGQGVETLHRYRKSFRNYSDESLTVSCFLYAMLSGFFIAVFLIKYRIEYIVAFPFIAGLFAIYMWLALRQGSVAQRPERLFRSRRLLATVGLAVLSVAFATVVDLPWLNSLSQPSLIHVD
ncbi:MAG TPA: hypothetical protein DCG90_00110 [Sphingobium sp.]|jgi:4-hydroxybenzoate polyprenyltransferase|uniref:UbiA family prenyltransferase n=1 Tax=unclassified Sphingobium TaxID=2611147 RepID=UPI0007F505EB|nr:MULTISPECIES: UbiA family prenyltransferase [unclassified Sphingobium]OAN56689.1 hypothetical protein A7Q26_19160 [Sphingobium sp. TCM1]WIW90724.1 UbiA family prenyltransferase [Sphingobium sp. V4]HAF40174.1 hypothetical protein [Sphingobium sp.]